MTSRHRSPHRRTTTALGRATALALAAVVPLVLAGCDDDSSPTGTDDDDPVLEWTSPEEVLANFEAAYRARDVERYREVLDERYVFHPNTDDGSDPCHLLRDVELDWADVMFAEVDAIDLALEPGEIVPSTMEAFPADEGFLETTAVVNLDVLTRFEDTGSGELVTFRVSGDRSRFVFAPRGSSPVEYALVYHEDLGGTFPRQGARTEDYTWSQVKGVYDGLPGEVGLAPITPQNVLDTFGRAFAGHDLDTYGATLAETFEFRAAPGDDVSYTTLDRAQELGSTGRLFDNAEVQELRLISTAAEPSDDPEFPGAEGYRQIDSVVRLTVVTSSTDPGSGEPIVFALQNDDARFVFEPDRSVRPITYRIVMQEDRHVAGGARVETVSWGLIKEFYLDENPPEYVAATTAEAALENFIEAYRRRDVDGYAATLASGFLFVPSDDADIDFEELTYAEDVAITERMFDQASDIQITLNHSGAVPSDRVDYPASEGYLKIVVPAALLDLAVGELVSRVAGDPIIFIFEPVTSGPETLYRVVNQRDLHTSAARAGVDARSSGPGYTSARTEESSWSALKSLFL